MQPPDVAAFVLELAVNKRIAAGLLAALSPPALAGGSVAPAAAPIAVTAVAAVPAVTWAGGYAGASLGYGDLSLEADLEDLGEDFLPGFDIDELPSLSLSDGGVACGAHLGCNWQNGRTVFGVEAAVLGSQAELEAAGEGMSLGAELDMPRA
jgi:opacity protein-like surface antigen